jgi:transcriptional repressor NrdR
MNCPKCGSEKSVVKDSRAVEYGRRRRRECCHCGFRYTVIEILAEDYKKYKSMLAGEGNENK